MMSFYNKSAIFYRCSVITSKKTLQNVISNNVKFVSFARTGMLYNFHTSSCIRDKPSVKGQTDQIDNLRGPEVEFGHSRAQDVYQNAVEEKSFEPNNTSSNIPNNQEDDKEHLAAYNCASSVHLNAVMQTMVPDPFVVKGKAPVHLNMPGGSWSQGQKYLSDQQHTLHQNVHGKIPNVLISQKRDCHQQSTPTEVNLTQRQKLKQAVKDYGSTVIVFHVSMSLCSLGVCYLAVSSGLDVSAILTAIGFSNNTIAVGGSTFVVSYALHKVFAPVRIGITLSATPFIVKYLRKKGILKLPK